MEAPRDKKDGGANPRGGVLPDGSTPAPMEGLQAEGTGTRRNAPRLPRMCFYWRTPRLAGQLFPATPSQRFRDEGLRELQRVTRARPT